MCDYSDLSVAGDCTASLAVLVAAPAVVLDLTPLYWVNFAGVIVIGALAWFLRRLVTSLDDMVKKVQELEIDVQYLVRKDRSRRLHDYDNGSVKDRRTP